MGQYPSHDVEHESCEALVRFVAPGSPADDAGFTPGCIIRSVDGQPVRDIIDWEWLTADDEIVIGYCDADGDEGELELWREPGEYWGFEFEGLVFDEVKRCRNRCTFCFMKQLPKGMRGSLYVRDDDYRLSFLTGTFVTLTNITPDDEQRIVSQRLSPLRVSLQASDAQVRERIIGPHAAHGLAVLDRLLDEGIEFHAQIVLVPGENDGEELDKTLAWAWERPGIENIGIVPLGYTRHQVDFDESFNDPVRAKALLDQIAPYQARALAERGKPWVFAADEFYANAYGSDVIDMIPDASWYGDYDLFEDGLGMIRSFVDDWNACVETGQLESVLAALADAQCEAAIIAGCAQKPFLDPLLARDAQDGRLRALYVSNEYFGGNVDVTGLLVGEDIGRAIAQDCAARSDTGLQTLYLVPRVVLNDDGVMLDGASVADVEKRAGVPLHVVSLSPLDYCKEIESLCTER